MAKTGRHYYFVARNEKTKTGYHISFPNIPNVEGSRDNIRRDRLLFISGLG